MRDSRLLLRAAQTFAGRATLRLLLSHPNALRALPAKEGKRSPMPKGQGTIARKVMLLAVSQPTKCSKKS